MDLAERWSDAVQNSIKAHGGLVGYWWILWADYLFGGQATAIKWFYIFLLIALLIAISIYYKVKIPAIKFESMKSSYEYTKKTTAKAAKKASAAVSKVSKKESNIEEDLDAIQEIEAQEYDKQTIKSMIKEKLNKSVKKKADEASIKELHVNFPQDKPTFDLNLLEKGNSHDIRVDEERLLKKAQWK